MSENVQGHQNTEATAMLSIVQVVQILPGLFLILGACTTVTAVVLCVSKCVCVCHCASYYIPVVYVENKVPLGFRGRYNIMHCLDCVENALFKSSGDIF